MKDTEDTDEDEEVDVEEMVGEWRARASELFESTTLSRRQSEVWALKEAGLIHKEIAPVIGISKEAVDNYSVRINRKRSEALATVEALTVDEEVDAEEMHAQALSREDVVDTFGASPVELFGHSVVQVVEDASRREDDVGLGGEVTSYYCASCDTVSPFASTFAGSECSGEQPPEDAEAEEVSA